MGNQKTKVKVASIGLGWVTLNRHLPSMDESDLFEVIGVIDHHQGKAEYVSRKKGYLHYYETNNLEDVPWLDKVDAIVIGTNPHAHYKLIKSAFNMGKHVLTEKPFVMSVKEGKEIVEIAHQKNLILGIVHNFQFASCTQKLMNDLKNNSLGKIKAIQATQLSNPKRRLPKWFDELPLGLFFDESPHFFYLLSRLSPGPLEMLTCHAFPSSLGLNTPALIYATYCCNSEEHGVLPVTINMNFEATVSEWHITVFGENCLVDIDIFRDIYIKLPNDGLHTTATVFRTSLLAAYQHFAQHFTSGIKHLAGKLRYGNDILFKIFAEAVLKGEEPKYIGINNALKVLQMQEDVIKKHIVLEKTKVC